MRLSCGCALVRGVKDASGRVWCVYHDRLAWVDDEGAAPIDAEVTLLDQSLIDAQHTLAQLAAQIGTVAKHAEAAQTRAESESRIVLDQALRIQKLENELRREREQWAPDTRTAARCRLALAAFYRAPVTMSSLQPLLDLAVELNPSLAASTRVSGRPNISADELGKYLKTITDDIAGDRKEDR